MSSFVLNEVRRGFYLDSVALMRLSRAIADLPGVEEAALMMGTPANKRILGDAGLLTPAAESAQGNDLIIGIRTESDAAAKAALAAALRELEAPRARVGPEDVWRPRSLRAAIQTLPEANLALISVPGDFAAAEARKALRRGLHVLIFSDNVSLEDERALKVEARELGRLVMGPDCGTAIINGVPLAFANRVPTGDIGIVGASGTGIQEVSSLIAEAGGGISQAIGVGGRDLNERIGAVTTLMALDALDRDPRTRRIVLLSKPPHPDVARRVAERIAESPKDFVVCFLGAAELALPTNARPARTLKETAEAALGGIRVGAGFDPAAAARLIRSTRAHQPARKRILGLFSGGTLCAEVQIVLAACGRQVASNTPVPGSSTLAAAGEASDRIIDLGADEYTRGRPHPMLDPSVRDDALRAALADPNAAAVVIDLVIGLGSEGNPAEYVARVLAGAPPDRPPVVASVTGTEQDPQVRSRQAERLVQAGVWVAPSNAQAAELAAALSRGSG